MLLNEIPAKVEGGHRPTVVFAVHLCAHLAARYPVPRRYDHRRGEAASEAAPHVEHAKGCAALASSVQTVLHVMAVLRMRARMRTETAAFWRSLFPALRTIVASVPHAIGEVALLLDGPFQSTAGRSSWGHRSHHLRLYDSAYRAGGRGWQIFAHPKRLHSPRRPPPCGLRSRPTLSSSRAYVRLPVHEAARHICTYIAWDRTQMRARPRSRAIGRVRGMLGPGRGPTGHTTGRRQATHRPI